MDESGWLGRFRQLRNEYSPNFFVADPSEPGDIAAMRRSLGGHPVVYGADNSITEGVRRVSIAMLTGPDGKPNLLVSDRCVNLIRELEGYIYKEVKGTPTEEPVDVENHACDALRYGVMALT
jgi:hypothetical protein